MLKLLHHEIRESFRSSQRICGRGMEGLENITYMFQAFLSFGK